MKSLIGMVELMERYCKNCDSFELRKNDNSETIFACKINKFDSCYMSYTGSDTMRYWR